jgi:hypothetical protein
MDLKELSAQEQQESKQKLLQFQQNLDTKLKKLDSEQEK